MRHADELRRQQLLAQRFSAMGLEVELMPDLRAVVVTLPVGSEPFETVDSAQVLEAVRFYTVGHDRIKCLAPRALGYLPIIRIWGCEKARDVENRIRKAWSKRVEALRDARSWLRRMGLEPGSPGGAPVWSFPLGLESRAQGAALEPGRVILPSRGPLSGLVLADPGERAFAPDAGCSSPVELELAVTARLEELARKRRRRAPRPVAPRMERRIGGARHAAPLLLVGARLARDHRLHESLRVRGLGVYGVPSMADAIDSFRQRSYEVVLVEAHLDRADGIELIPTLRTLPGILELPVAVLDDRSRESRKASAKRAGATAYLGGEPDPGRLGQVLMRLFTGYRRRRFRRYELALAATVPGRRESALTGNVGRRGAFVRTAPEAPDGTYAFHVPELGRLVRVHADVVDRRDDPRSGASGICLHFRAFEAGDEPLWIDYLTRLESTGRERL